MNQQTVEPGDYVTVHYTGKGENDTIFATSTDGPPVQFKVGAAEVIAGLDDGVVGMKEGDLQNFRVSPEEAFGNYRRELVTTVTRADFPENISPEEGKSLRVRTGEGKLVEVRITKIEGEKVTIDANHPLAGQTIELDVEMVNIQKSPP